jgi:nicotinamide mononucleotide (NMN) deamidase PncC
MKKITLKLKHILFFCVFLVSSIGYAQDLLLGFQSGESGGVVGEPFGNAPAPVVEVGTGTNTTQVLKIVGNPTGEPWQGINLTLTSPVNLTTTKTMTMDVFSASAITFLVKVTGGTGGPATAASASHPGGSVWQTVSFTFNTALDGQAPLANGVYSGFVIHTYWAAGATGFFNPTVPTPARTFYVDNIRGPLGTPPVVPQPATAAPTPPARVAADVKSIFSNAYTPISTIGYAGNDNSYNTTWCPATTSLVSIEGNDTNKVVGLGCEGVAFQAGRFNATTFTHFHMDFWTSTPTEFKSFNIKFSNWNGGTEEANALEFSVTNANFLPNPNPGTWISLDIPLANFTPISGANRNDLVQFIISSDLGTVFYDNLYLHKNTVLSSNSFSKSAFKMYPNPSKDVLNISSETVIDNVIIYNTLGQIVAEQTSGNTQDAINVSSLPNGVYILSAQSGSEVIRKQFIKE